MSLPLKTGVSEGHPLFSNQMIYAVLNRLKDNDHAQTLGHLVLYEDENVLFDCKTLELPDRGNQRNISRFPGGCYVVKKRYSSKHKYHYHIQDVLDRSYILIHTGNYVRQVEGCIMVGDGFYDINGDGLLDVTSSRNTLNRLLNLAGDEFRLIVNDIDKTLE